MRQYGADGEVIGDPVNINLNMYKYKPNEDALNLQSLIRKFPEEDITDNLMAVGNFPLNGGSELSPRLFVYYIGISH